MVPQKLSVACSALAACAIAATAAAQSPASQTSVTKGIGTVTTDQLKGEVVEVEGNSLLVKLSSGDLRTFKVPDERRFTIDGKEVSVHDLEPGTTLTATVKTTTTPITVRTKAVQSGKVWFVSPPHVILTLPSGENKQYEVKDDVKFVLNGKPATVFELKKGMVVSAEKIVEAPEVEITTATRVVGQAPAARAWSSRCGRRCRCRSGHRGGRGIRDCGWCDIGRDATRRTGGRGWFELDDVGRADCPGPGGPGRRGPRPEVI
jgi:hypothetical protein